MPGIFHVHYTKPIPKKAVIVLVGGIKHARWTSKGTQRTEPLTDDGKRVQLKSSKYYGEYTDDNGEVIRVVLSKDYETSVVMLSNLIKKAERARDGDKDPTEKHRGKDLAQLIGEYHAYLKARKKKPSYVEPKISRIKRTFLQWCGYKRPRDIDWLEVFTAVAKNVPNEQTAFHYVSIAKSFTKWLVSIHAIQHDPLSELEKPTVVEKDRLRRPLRDIEAEKLFELVLFSNTTYRKLSGRDRYHLYRLAADTGLRASELERLTRRHFRLVNGNPVVYLPGTGTKNKRQAEVPITPSYAVLLAAYLEGKEPDEIVWKGTWKEKGAEMVRRDLALAGIPFIVKRPDGDRRFDFHAWRHTYVYRLKTAGIPLVQAMKLARHCDAKLFTDVYGMFDTQDMADAVNSMPDIVPSHMTPEQITAGLQRLADTENDLLAGKSATVLRQTPVYRELLKMGWKTWQIDDCVQAMYLTGLPITEWTTTEKEKYARRGSNPQPMVSKGIAPTAESADTKGTSDDAADSLQEILRFPVGADEMAAMIKALPRKEQKKLQARCNEGRKHG